MRLLEGLSSLQMEAALVSHLGRIADALEDIATALHVEPPDTEIEVVSIDDVLEGDPPPPDESVGLEELESEQEGDQ